MNEASEQPAIELRGVGVRRGQRWIVQEIDWCVPAGTCAAILGPNGSGKSTLARIISGYIWPTVGEVYVNGEHFGDVDLNALRRTIRLVQPAGPYDVDASLSAREVVLTGLFGTIGLFDPVTPADVASADGLLAQVGMTGLAAAKYHTLSSGERVRALIARALIQKPRVLLLDEPTAGLDLLAREQILGTVQAMFSSGNTPPTVLLITHHIEELPPVVGRVLLLDGGRVAGEGPPEQVLRDEPLSRAYRCQLHVQRMDGRYYVRVDPRGWEGLLRS